MSYEHSSLLYIITCSTETALPLSHPSVHMHAPLTMTTAQAIHVTCLEVSICLCQ